MDISSATTPLAAFVAGLAVSVHCAAMCGPLACAVKVRPAQYHLSRVGSYATVGAVCGFLGESASALFKSKPLQLAPWALAVLLLAVALGLEKRIPQPRILGKLMLKARLNASLGWLTPLIPCGPLWLIFGVAVVSASWWSGALVAGSFAVGTIPLYWLFQAQLVRLNTRLSPLALQRLQRGFAFVAASLLVWRAVAPDHACCL